MNTHQEREAKMYKEYSEIFIGKVCIWKWFDTPSTQYTINTLMVFPLSCAHYKWAQNILYQIILNDIYFL